MIIHEIFLHWYCWSQFLCWKKKEIKTSNMRMIVVPIILIFAPLRYCNLRLSISKISAFSATSIALNDWKIMSSPLRKLAFHTRVKESCKVRFFFNQTRNAYFLSKVVKGLDGFLFFFDSFWPNPWQKDFPSTHHYRPNARDKFPRQVSLTWRLRHFRQAVWYFSRNFVLVVSKP